MKTYYECLPCFVNQTLDAVRQFSDDGNKNDQVLRKVLHEMSKMDFNESPPKMGQLIHRIIRHYLGDGDPYRQIKKSCNSFGLKLYPEFKKRIVQSCNPFETAVRLTIGGNIIDYGVISNLDDSSVYDTIESSLKEQLSSDDIKEFESAVNRATDILYLGDNTGEIVFDRLLIEQLLPRKVTFAVRGSPVINDVTIADARETGMTDIVEVIDNGSDAPGTILEDCSEAFRKRFENADLIIAKGQGNYESLSDIEKNIFFVLMAKCPVIARNIGCDVGELILKKSAVN